LKKKLRDDVLTFYKKMGGVVDLILGPSPREKEASDKNCKTNRNQTFPSFGGGWGGF
jgi:hypothetical protein